MKAVKNFSPHGTIKLYGDIFWDRKAFERQKERHACHNCESGGYVSTEKDKSLDLDFLKEE